MNRILLIDDHAIVRLGMRSLIETREDLCVVAEAGTRQEALEIIRGHPNHPPVLCPDLAVVDLVLGADDGLEFVKELKGLSPKMRILVVTMQDELVYAQRVLKAGAHGFLQKRDAARHLLEAVDIILEGDIYLSRASKARIPGTCLKEDAHGETTVIAALSDRELHVFQMVGTGLGNKEIARHLGLSPKTIETYKENLKHKLNMHNTAELRELAEKWVVQGEL